MALKKKKPHKKKPPFRDLGKVVKTNRIPPPPSDEASSGSPTDSLGCFEASSASAGSPTGGSPEISEASSASAGTHHGALPSAHEDPPASEKSAPQTGLSEDFSSSAISWWKRFNSHYPTLNKCEDSYNLESGEKMCYNPKLCN